PASVCTMLEPWAASGAPGVKAPRVAAAARAARTAVRGGRAGRLTRGLLLDRARPDGNPARRPNRPQQRLEWIGRMAFSTAAPAAHRAEARATGRRTPWEMSTAPEEP